MQPGTDAQAWAQGRLEPAPDVLSRTVGDETVLVDLATNRIYSLNVTGARFWELLAEDGELANVFARLREEFDVPEQALAEEIRTFCELLERERLVSRPGG